MATTQKTSTSSVTTAAKRPAQTTMFLTKLRTALSIFNDQISSLGEERSTAYKTFITKYKEAFTKIWPKIQAADVTFLLSSIKDTELHKLRRLSEQLCPDKAKPTLLKEKRDVPTSDKILGSLISRIPEQKLPGKEACSLIADIFSDLAEAHKFYAHATKGLADIAGLVSPEQLTLILATAVPPTLQLVLLPGQISLLSIPPPPPETSTTPTGRQELIQYCKRQILPDHLAAAFEDCEPRTPTQVLAAAIFSTLEKHLFDSTTARAEVTSNFSITAAQLHKAITGVEYKSGPHVYKKKKCMTTETVTTTSAVQKTTLDPSPVSKEASPTTLQEPDDADQHTEQIQAKDTLSSSSDSEPLYNPF